MWVQKAGFYSSVSLPRGCEPPVSAIFGDHRAQQQELIRVSGLSCSVNHDGLAPCPLHQCCHSPSLTRSEETESLSLLRSYPPLLFSRSHSSAHDPIFSLPGWLPLVGGTAFVGAASGGIKEGACALLRRSLSLSFSTSFHPLCRAQFFQASLFRKWGGGERRREAGGGE